MPQATQPTVQQREQFRQMAETMAQTIIRALDGPQHTFVVLEALCMVHRVTTLQLPADAVGQVAMAMASYAGELLQQSAALSNPPAGGSCAVH